MEPIKDNNTPLKIALFVSFQVWLNGRSLTDFATDKARALLVYLLIERQQPHRRESLATLLWPDQPDARARQNLRQALSNLGQALGDSEDSPNPYLLIDRHLAVSTFFIDILHQFENDIVERVRTFIEIYDA